MRNDLAIVRFIMKPENSTEVLECSWSPLANEQGTKVRKDGRPTELQVLLRAIHKLGNSDRQAFGQDEVFAAERMLADEEAENLD